MSEDALNQRACSARLLPALVAKKGLHVAQVGSAFVEEQRRGRMPKRMCGNDRHPRTLAGEFDPSVERLVAKGSAVTARKD